jgi:ribose 5-phosphate isomerase A
MDSSSTLIERALLDLGYQTAKPVIRERNGKAFVTDEGNHIFDLHLDTVLDPAVLSQTLNDIPGVVENGLFLNMCETVIIGYEDGSSETRSLVDGALTSSRADNVENLFSDIGD